MAAQAGPGIQAQMKANDDHPIEDSTFTQNRDGSTVERALGTKGLYVSSNASGDWENVGPFGVAE